ncbi:hypothetical protein AMJ57_02945 [Parcubacteria bacterium SG8_24]|nr:MAG: hypothetical protein AMJ57_02945 [Parcubacteria bacterium SG8_24]
MIDNHTYNLILQLVQENKSLWRIENHYLGDAETCADCRELWERVKKAKEESVAEMMELLKRHLTA